jgi:hypothetical protein
MKNIIRTSENVLIENALAILELPERIERIDNIILKELLIYLVQEKKDRDTFILKFIEINENYNYPIDYKPDKLKQYWEERQSQGKLGEYYKVKYLENLVRNRIEFLQTQQDNYRSGLEYSYLKIFRKNGFNLFKYIDKDYDEHKIKKYSFMYHFLYGRINQPYTIKCDAETFRIFLNEQYLNNKKVSRISGYASDQFQIHIDEYENTIINYFDDLKTRFINSLKEMKKY